MVEILDEIGNHPIRIRVWISRREITGLFDGTERWEAFERYLIEHRDELRNSPHMFEVEFLDEPDRLQRFLRFGTDRDLMTMPIAVKFQD